MLSHMYRGKIVAGLEALFAKSGLRLPPDLGQEPARRRLLAELRRTAWVVYAKPPFAGPQAVLQYLGRYTHRIAISNNRLVSFDGREVRFRWRDYAHGNRRGVMRLSVGEFLRRFLLHGMRNWGQSEVFFATDRKRHASEQACIWKLLRSDPDYALSQSACTPPAVSMPKSQETAHARADGHSAFVGGLPRTASPCAPRRPHWLVRNACPGPRSNPTNRQPVAPHATALANSSPTRSKFRYVGHAL
ncbi:MAG: transposase [Rhodocyclaceae bacterium]|nr:transposase [Rhodocyclaceae bacterium]